MTAPARTAGARLPLAARRRAARAEARRRVAARTSQPIAASLASVDAISRGIGSTEDRALAAGIALGAAIAVHAAVFAIGWWLDDDDDDERKPTAVEIEVRARKIEPLPPLPKIELPPLEPEPRHVEPPPRVREPEKVVTPEPEKPPPDEPARKPPPRVVGLSLEATTGDGQGGSFATGNTAHGKTEAIAKAPEKLPPAPAKQEVAPAKPATGTNQVASRIPTATAKYVLPKRKRATKPPYPDTLKSQGIEADVTVVVQIDDTGKVVSVKIAKGSPYPEFDEAARQTALAEQFDPATRDGVAVPYTLSFTYRFRLED